MGYLAPTFRIRTLCPLMMILAVNQGVSDGRGNLLYSGRRSTHDFSGRGRREKCAQCLRKYVHGHFAQRLTLGRATGNITGPQGQMAVSSTANSAQHTRWQDRNRRKEPLQAIAIANPMDMVYMDLIRPVTPESNRGQRYACLAVDYMSRFLWALLTSSPIRGRLISEPLRLHP